MAELIDRLHVNLTHLPAATAYWVAYSGGMDSHVLLHAMAALARGGRCTSVRAIHVNHQLSLNAQRWADHCVRRCAELGVACRVEAVDATPRGGESREAAARHARYAALTQILDEGEAVLTAQHLQDQAETLLLQLIRGAGVRGLSAMGAVRPLGSGWLGRPLLGEARSELHRYARMHALDWIDDPTNFDTSLERNFIRHEVLPVLEQRRPAVCRALSRSAQHLAEAGELLDELARSDLATTRGTRPGTLSISALHRLTPARQRNVLRTWLDEHSVRMPDRRRLLRIQQEVIPARADATPVVAWGAVQVRRHRDDLHVLTGSHVEPEPRTYPWPHLNQPLPLPQQGMQLRVVTAAPGEAGIDPVWLATQSISVRFRHGGERCRLQAGGVARTLKKLLQEWDVPSWERSSIPLIYAGDTLVAVAGHCICAGSAPALGVGGVRVEVERLEGEFGR